MAKGNKKLGGKKKLGGNKKLGGKKRLGHKKKLGGKKKKYGKGKKRIKFPKTELEIKLTKQMKRRTHKKMRPMKVLQDKYKSILEHYDKKGLGRPVYLVSPVTKQSNMVIPIPKYTNRPMNNLSLGELGKIFLIKRTAMSEKKKGVEDDSPININTAIVKKCNYLRLLFEGLFDPERKSVIKNSGYHVIGHLGGEVLISNGPLFGKYKLYNFHVHYGEACDDGTEHAINSRRFTLEMHIVFTQHSGNIDPTQEPFTMVAKKVVLSLLFKLSHKTCHYDLFDVVTHISLKGKSLETSNNLLYDFKDVLSGSEYYNYSGSATEGVHKDYEWLVFKKILPINKNQMQNMWDLRKFDAVKSNVKPLQVLGQRTIYTPTYYDHQKCRGKESCDCFGHSKPM